MGYYDAGVNRRWLLEQLAGSWNYKDQLGRHFYLINYGAVAAAMGWTEDDMFKYGYWTPIDKDFVRKGIEIEADCP